MLYCELLYAVYIGIYINEIAVNVCDKLLHLLKLQLNANMKINDAILSRRSSKNKGHFETSSNAVRTYEKRAKAPASNSVYMCVTVYIYSGRWWMHRRNAKWLVAADVVYSSCTIHAYTALSRRGCINMHTRTRDLYRLYFPKAQSAPHATTFARTAQFPRAISARGINSSITITFCLYKSNKHSI